MAADQGARRRGPAGGGLQRRRGRAGERALRQDDRGAADEGEGRRPSGATNRAAKRPPPTHRQAGRRPARRSRPPSRHRRLARRREEAALPESLSPQLATLVAEPPAGDGWIYEIKFDGYRVLARIDGDDVRLFTRNGNDWSERMPALVEAVRAARPRLGLARRRDRRHRRATARPTSTRCRTPSTPRGPASIQLLPVRPALLRRPRPAQRAAGRAPRASSPGCSSGAPPSERIRFSENFDAAPRELLQNACRMRPRRHDRQARRFALRLAAHARPGSSSSARSARSS